MTRHKKILHEGVKDNCRQCNKVFTTNKTHYRKESNTFADISTRNFQTREILLNTKGQYMKESNILADIGREVCLNTEGQYMKE